MCGYATPTARRGWRAGAGRTWHAAGRVNGVLAGVHGMVAHAVAEGRAPARQLPAVYEIADDRELPEQARAEEGRMAWRALMTQLNAAASA
jgi:hypothetical protein